MSVLVFFCLMFRRPPRPTSTATFVPYTTLFLSRHGLGEAGLLREVARELAHRLAARTFAAVHIPRQADDQPADAVVAAEGGELRGVLRSEEHTSELQSLMRISYAVFCLKQQNTHGANQKPIPDPISDITQ